MRHQISLLTGLLLALTLVACSPKPQPEPYLSRYDTPGHDTGVRTELSASRKAIRAPLSPNAVATTKTVKVGLLLPLTGRAGDIGRAMQDAATVALFDRYAQVSLQQQGIKVELLPVDTGDTPQQAASAMQQVADAGVEFVIGPLFGDATQAVAAIAKAKNIQVLSFSNNREQASAGVYMFGFSPQEQTERVVHYAVRAGKMRIAALTPDSPLGNVVLEAAQAALGSNGQVLVTQVHYPAQGVGIDAAVEQLVPQNSTRPNFDALLLPEGGTVLPTILRALEKRGVNRTTVQLLGTGIWDDAALLRRVTLDGAWLASSPPQDTSRFESRFRSTYNYNPPRIASLAYDAVSLAVTLATSNRAFDEKTLTATAGFSGPANGVFRLRPDGTVQRGLAVLQVDGGGFEVVDPSPAGFAQ